LGKRRYAKAKRLLITADGGDSNGYRVRLWKVEIQKLAEPRRDVPRTPASDCPLQAL
jgi:hypothetical protein